MSRRAIQQINWAAMLERTRDAEKPLFANLKAKSEQYLRKMTEFPETSPKIDWAMYKQSIPSAGLVDKFQKEYESLTIPYPPDNYTSKIDETAKSKEVEIQSTIEEGKAMMVKNNQEIEKIKNLIPFDQMTMEEACELYPERMIHPDRPSIWPHDEETNKPEDQYPKDDEHH